MKRWIPFVVLLALGVYARAQAPPTTTPPVSGQSFWSRTGNSFTPGGSNVIGTFFSSPMYFKTDSVLRMRINGNMPSSVNSLPSIARNGYVGLGNNLNSAWSNVNPGPFSLLHLNGNGSFVQQFGYRNWMQNGITFTSNDDFAYIGHKQNPGSPNGLDITDLVVAWGDNAGLGTVGPDVMKFVFTTGTGSSNNDLIGDHPDGREIMRLSGFGNVGIGPRFSNTASGQPQSQLHINSENSTDVALQLTVQNLGQLLGDGLRLRVAGGSGEARIDQQENANLLLFTGTSSGGGERMRIASIATSTNPASLPADVGRVSISHRPGSPVIRPLSLLHLGYDTTNPTNNNGWRPWMDVGTFTASGSDHMYVGLKREPPTLALAGDRLDAVISWGDNANPNPAVSGPDFLRFIFTTTTADTFDPIAAAANGREIMRLTPSGNVGIGDYASSNPPIGARLDIDGDLRIRTLTPNNNLSQVLVADPGDLNRVHWRNAATLSSPFFACPTSVPADKLPSNSWWELNNFNFVFAGQGGTNNSVGIGTNCTPAAKLHIFRQLVTPAVFNPTGLRVEHTDISLPGPVLGVATGIASSITGSNRQNIAGDFSARGANVNIGVRGDSINANFTNIGGRFNAGGTGTMHYGIWASAPAGPPHLAGFFNGDVTVTGVLNWSDQRLKRDTQPIANATDIIRRLQPKTFFFDPAAEPRLSLPRGRQYGLIAQEVERVLPDVVREVTLPAEDEKERPVTFKTVNYDAFIGLLIAGMQKQQQEIEELRTQVAELAARVKGSAPVR
jgi:hypothetical protein